MTKYIDSEAFFKVINTLPYKDTSYPDASAYNGAISDVADMLTHFPAANVAEVVRCKECKHSRSDEFEPLWCYASETCDPVKEDHFCGYGERRDE